MGKPLNVIFLLHLAEKIRAVPSENAGVYEHKFWLN